jgi:hypothetical protein
MLLAHAEQDRDVLALYNVPAREGYLLALAGDDARHVVAQRHTDGLFHIYLLEHIFRTSHRSVIAGFDPKIQRLYVSGLSLR